MDKMVYLKIRKIVQVIIPVYTWARVTMLTTRSLVVPTAFLINAYRLAFILTIMNASVNANEGVCHHLACSDSNWSKASGQKQVVKSKWSKASGQNVTHFILLFTVVKCFNTNH